MSSRAPAYDGRIAGLRGWVQARLHEEISRDRVAEELGISASHFSQLFRCVHGVSFSCWLRRMRVEQAERRLVEGDLNVGEVADACGFGSMRTLQRQFKKVYGVSPSEYRAMRWRTQAEESGKRGRRDERTIPPGFGGGG